MSRLHPQQAGVVVVNDGHRELGDGAVAVDRAQAGEPSLLQQASELAAHGERADAAVGGDAAVDAGDRDVLAQVGARPRLAQQPRPALAPQRRADRADDEQGGVLFGVYTGNDKKEFFSFEGAFGRRIEAVLAYTGDRNWQDANPGWQLSPRWLAGTGRELLWSIPMIPNDEVVQTSREAANGAHNETYQSWARQILESRSDDDRPIYVRTTWEVGGEWFYWTEAAKEDPEAFKAAWRQWAQSFHAVSPRFKMVWDFTADRGPVEQWYPGDEAVDVISQDIYWNPQWQGDDPVEAFETSVSGYSRGLAWMAEFATQHDKPMAISEWSPGDRPGAEVWIEQFSQWVHSHNVVYTTYWAGGEGSGYDGTLSEGPVLEALREFAAKCGSRPLP